LFGNKILFLFTNERKLSYSTKKRMLETLIIRLLAGIKIIDHAALNDTTLTQACIFYKRPERFLRTLRGSTPTTPEEKEIYDKFIKKYNSFISNQFDDLKKEILEESGDDGLLGGETIIEKEQTHQTKTDNTIEVDYRGNEIIKTAEQLVKAADIDLNVWKIDKEIANKWDVTMKLKKTEYDENGKPVQTTTDPATFQNFQVKLFLSRIRTQEEQRVWENFLVNIRDNAPDLSYLTKPHSAQGKKYMLELSLPDLHIGKLAWEDESGENYDTKIAIQRYNESVEKLLSHVAHYKDEIEEILLPVGNDLFNIDNMLNKTTAGTDQRVDSRWQQMFQKAKDLLIENINKLSAIAPVKVMMVSGNHDYQTVYYLGCVLQAYYHKSTNVTINNDATQRKYHVYGINLIGFTHGNEEKHQELGLIMATEKPDLWAKTKCRQMHLGHFHSRKTTKYLDVQEFQGFTVRILPSLSGTDDWHNRKGYMSMKSAIAFLYAKDNGLVAEFSHNII